MEHDFWHEVWQRHEIGFHEGRPNAALQRHLPMLDLAPGARLFLPLCGKTRDLGWLMGRGHGVAGAELSAIAVRELFEELNLTPEATPLGALSRFSAPGIDIFQGDIFDLTPEALGPVGAVFDRAALVALPSILRPRYASHLATVTGGATQLLLTFEFDQAQGSGPPFSVPGQEVAALYGSAYRISELERTDLPSGLRGRGGQIVVWHLAPLGEKAKKPASHPGAKPL